MLYGLKLCLLSLGISGCVFTGDQHGSMKLEKQKEAFQSHGSQPEVDRIGSALQESLLNLNEEVCDDSLDGVDRRLCSMSVTSSDVSACSISTTSNEETNIDEVMHVLNLWTHVSDRDKQDMELGLLSSQEMEKFHSITSSSTKNVRHIPGMYDPLKVGYHLSPYYFNSLCFELDHLTQVERDRYYY